MRRLHWFVALGVAAATWQAQGAERLRPPKVRVAHYVGHEPPRISASDAKGAYRIRVVTEPARPVAGRETRLKVFLTGPTDKPLNRLKIRHERLAHFLLVSENLAEFHHLHPEDFGLLTESARSQGLFEMPVTFGAGGRHLLSMDFMDGERAVHHEAWIAVDGPAQAATSWRMSRRRSVEGLDAELFLLPDAPEPGGSVEGTIKVSLGGEPLKDLDSYLGALAHLAIYREGATSSAHVHGVGSQDGGSAGHGAQGASHDGRSGASSPAGPYVYFGYTFDEPGRYRLFVQMQRRGMVFTVPFDVEVSESSHAR